MAKAIFTRKEVEEFTDDYRFPIFTLTHTKLPRFPKNFFLSDRPGHTSDGDGEYKKPDDLFVECHAPMFELLVYDSQYPCNCLRPSQFITLIGAGRAQFGAGLAVLVLVLATFHGTFHAHFGTNFTQVFRIRTVHAQQLCGGGTDGGTFDVQLCTTSHHFHILFMQIHGSAITADGRAA